MSKKDKFDLTNDRLHQVVSYDAEADEFRWLLPSRTMPNRVGTVAGYTDSDDGTRYVTVDGKSYSHRRLSGFYQTGKWPTRGNYNAHERLTHARLAEMLSYDPLTGIFLRKGYKAGVKIGARADYVENNGYRYVNLDGKRYLAARLAWFYVNAAWPTRYVRFADDDQNNCAIGNLSCPEPEPHELRLAKDRARVKANPDHFRSYNLRRDFGISLEQYQDAFAAQGGVCACCHKPEVSERDGKRKWLAVDHDHTDGSFRGLLCSNCNQGLGRFADDVEVLRRAADYIEAHAAKPKTNVIPLAGRRIANARGDSQ